MILAGFPTTTEYGGTSFVTTALAPITEPSPILTPGRIVALSPIQTFSPITTFPLDTSERDTGGGKILYILRYLHENCL